MHILVHLLHRDFVRLNVSIHILGVPWHRYTITQHTVISCTCITVTHCYTWHHYFSFMSHWYTDTLFHWIPSFHIFVSSLHGCSVHSYIMFIHHYNIDLLVYMRCLFLYSYCMDHCSYYMDYYYMYILVFPLHECFLLLILILMLLDLSVVDMRCVELGATWI